MSENPTSAPEAVKADARERARRTLKQGLLFAVLAGISTAALQVVSAWTHNDFLSSASWVLLGTSVLQAGMVSAFSYFNRLTNTPDNSVG